MKKVLFLISVMQGGGAERVITVLSDMLVKNGYDVSVIVTSDIKGNSRLELLNPEVKTFFLTDYEEEHHSFASKSLLFVARVFGKLGLSEYSSILKYRSRNIGKVKALKRLLKLSGGSAVISFLNEPIFLSLLAKGKNKVIISERNNPEEFVKTKTTMAFIHKMYPKADIMVCQSPDAQKWYNNNSSVKTTVIYNPIKTDLPEPYAGARNRKIVNYCRIASEKNLALLITAFALIKEEYSEYELFIYGNAIGKAGDDYLKDINGIIKEKNLCDSVHILPARNDIHDVIKDCAMFVSSSDFEGMSNSMLEAMAMGMPCVCTDCPAGGARAVITDHVNGILTPVGDAEALYQAMKELIDNPELANRLGENAVKVREEQSTEKIIKKWMELIDG